MPASSAVLKISINGNSGFPVAQAKPLQVSVSLLFLSCSIWSMWRNRRSTFIIHLILGFELYGSTYMQGFFLFFNKYMCCSQFLVWNLWMLKASCTQWAMPIYIGDLNICGFGNLRSGPETNSQQILRDNLNLGGDKTYTCFSTVRILAPPNFHVAKGSTVYPKFDHLLAPPLQWIWFKKPFSLAWTIAVIY